MTGRLYTTQQVRELDRIAIQHGIAGYDLMQRAGQACFNQCLRSFPQAKSLAVFCGSGNNAGDGYVIARLAREHHLEVRVIQVGDEKQLQGDARVAFDAMTTAGISTESLSDAMPEVDVCIDALFGTGLSRDIDGDFRTAIRLINETPAPTLSVDIPSGLCADTGKIFGICIKADCTVTFIAQKRGMHTGNAADVCGEIVFDDLSVPGEVYAQMTGHTQLVAWADCEHQFPRRNRTAHKGHFGHVLLIGGDYGFAGAVGMAAEAAARTGAGLVSVATRKEHAVAIGIRRPELMCHAVTKPADVQALLEKATAVAIGPGLGQSEWARELFAVVLQSNKAVVIDADALNLLAQEPNHVTNHILTPHPGEAARLLQTATSDIQSDRFAAVESLQKKYGGVVVLKGSGTLIRDESGQTCVCSGGNPGMATGGIGDVLTGIIVGLIAQGFSLAEAAKSGVCLHAQAADKAAAINGERGMLASDLFPHIRKLVNPDLEN